MNHKLFVANLPENVTEDQLQDSFMTYGRVDELQLLTDEETGDFSGKATVTLETEEPLESVLEGLNTCRLDDHRLAVSPSEPPTTETKLTTDQRQTVKQIAKALDENQWLAEKQMSRLMQLCGKAFAQGLLEDTLRIESEGGLWLDKENRRRTPGGVYLHLARQWLSPTVKNGVFMRTKKKAKSKAPVGEAAPTENPAPDTTEHDSQAAASPSRQRVKEKSPQAAETPADTSPLLRAQLEELRRAHQEAQYLLAAVKAGQANASPMATMKAVVDTKRALDDFLREYPDLA